MPESGGGAGRAPVGEVKARHTARLLALPGVVGVGIGAERGQPVIAVYASGPGEADLRRALPAELEGYPVRLVVSGEFRAGQGAPSGFRP